MKNPKPSDNQLSVFISGRESQCDECGQALGSNAWIVLQENKKAACLTCADLDHLVFLPAGDAALTRRSRKYSQLCAVVLKWNKRRKRYERQGLLVENQALEKAECECNADAGQRKIRRAQAAVRRNELDQAYISRFAVRVRELYPNCPEHMETSIAEHACRKYSGRVGRSAAAKELNKKSVRLAVAAHIRHTQTNYDELLLKGINRKTAREMIRQTADQVLLLWELKS